MSVIVCTKDRPDDLRRCLDSLAALRTVPLELIVVDNSSGDPATAEICRGRSVRYVLESGRGSSRARNRGVAEARGEVVAFTDDDCMVDPGWLDGLADVFDDPLVMAVTGYCGPRSSSRPARNTSSKRTAAFSATRGRSYSRAARNRRWS